MILQAGDGRRDLDGISLPSHVSDLGEGLADFADTAAIIASLDLVITSDTAVAHLAGAMGQETWVMGWLQADWRWMPAPDGGPLWYPTARMFRQHAPHQWVDVVDQLRQALAALPGHIPAPAPSTTIVR
ncbi:hypothetical protein AZL_002880 [Azospirillum sp. B510]|nr:hypothetical protein AZL_002880 [Azospirillum sp. B510]